MIPQNLLGLPGVEMPKTIPECKWLIKRGEIPDKDMNNVYAWTPALAKRPLEFIPLEDAPSEGVAFDEMRHMMIIDEIKKLGPEDFTAEGPPKFVEMRRRLALPDLTVKELRAAWKDSQK